MSSKRCAQKRLHASYKDKGEKEASSSDTVEEDSAQAASQSEVSDPPFQFLSGLPKYKPHSKDSAETSPMINSDPEIFFKTNNKSHKSSINDQDESNLDLNPKARAFKPSVSFPDIPKTPRKKTTKVVGLSGQSEGACNIISKKGRHKPDAPGKSNRARPSSGYNTSRDLKLIQDLSDGIIFQEKTLATDSTSDSDSDSESTSSSSASSSSSDSDSDRTYDFKRHRGKKRSSKSKKRKTKKSGKKSKSKKSGINAKASAKVCSPQRWGT